MKQGTTRRLLSMLLALVLVLGLVPGTAFAAEDTRIPIMKLEATATGLDIQYGDRVDVVDFTVTAGDPAYFNIGMSSWQKKEGETWTMYTGETFKEGIYRYYVQVRTDEDHSVDGMNGTTHVLGNGGTVVVNGECWATMEMSPANTGDTFSYEPVYSPAITVTKPEMCSITHDPNGGTPGEHFSSDPVEFGKGTNLWFPEPQADYLSPPAGKVYAGVEIEGVTYDADDIYVLDHDITIKFLWNDAESNACFITYDVNGGTPGEHFPSEPVEFIKGDKFRFTLPPAELVSPPEGKVYAGVEIEGVIYAPNSTYVVDHDITIKFLWENAEPDLCFITYDVNGGTPGTDFPSEPVEFMKGETFRFTPPPAKLVTPPVGKVYAGVEIEGVTYAPGASLVIDHDVTIKLLWKEAEQDICIITYDANGGIPGEYYISSISDYPKGQTFIFSVPPADFLSPPEGKIFVGVEIEGVTYAPNTTYVVDHDITIKFLWKERISFSDVKDTAWYADAVQWASDSSITDGFPNGTFRPEDKCTRAQIVTFLWRMAGCPDPETAENPFSDVKESAWYAKAVLWAAENGITDGFPDGTFLPEQFCTRAQVVTFIHRFLRGGSAEGAENPFPDVKPGWYYDAVIFAVVAGITEGFPDGTFGPNELCTRAQIVTFLMRVGEAAGPT